MSSIRTVLTVSALTLPLMNAGAQARPRVSAPAAGPQASATELLNRRRELDLTPRQVARLDSIERAQWSQRRALMQQVRKQRDSICADRRPCTLSTEEREKVRALMEQNRPRREGLLRGDSAARALAMGLLDSTQRGRVQGWRMERRRAGLERMQRGFGAPGYRQFGANPGLRRGPGDRPLRPRLDRDDAFGPGFGPRGRVGPRYFERRRGMIDDRRDFPGVRMRRVPPRPPRGDAEDGVPGMEPDGARVRPDTLPR